MPRYPIYVPLLPPDAQRVIGKVHETSRPAMKNLEAEGFKFSGMVDIFDAGACVSCRRDDIRTVRQSRTAVVDDIADLPSDSPISMVGCFSPAFRATMGPVKSLERDRVSIDSNVAETLGVSRGDVIRHALLRAEPPSTAGPVRNSSKNLDHESD